MKRQEGVLASAPPAEIAIRSGVSVAGASNVHQPPLPRARVRRVARGTNGLPQLTSALEEQAHRIAHALHDDAGQLLAAIRIAIDGLEHEFPVVTPRLDMVRDLIGRVEHQLRTVAHELRPTILDDLGLSPALQVLVDSFRSDSGLSITIDQALPAWLPPTVAVAVYRLVQGALTNVARHAAATHVTIRIRTDQKLLRCSVEDNGCGFNVQAVRTAPRAGLGLVGVQEHINAAGGVLWIASSPGAGTKLVASIPLEPPDGYHSRTCR